MDRLISEQAVLDVINKAGRFYCDKEQTIKEIKAILSAEPKTGHWIFVDKAHEHAHCSECDYGNVDLMDGRPHKYCPNCGAKMVESQEV